MTSATTPYEQARGTLTGLPTPRGTWGPTPWDPALVEAMASARVKIEEELLLPKLLADLANPAPAER